MEQIFQYAGVYFALGIVTALIAMTFYAPEYMTRGMTLGSFVLWAMFGPLVLTVAAICWIILSAMRLIALTAGDRE